MDDITAVNEAVTEFNDALESGDMDRINEAYNYMQDVIAEVRRCPDAAGYLIDYLVTVETTLGETSTSLKELNSVDKAIAATNKKLVSSKLTT